MSKLANFILLKTFSNFQMELNKILSIGGKPGLYLLLSHSKAHIVVESLEDGKRFPVAGAQQINTLDNIAIYTLSKEVPLAEVFYAIFKKYEGKNVLSHQSSQQELLDFFADILPDYDRDRVYASNVKKVVQWYNSLLNRGFDFEKLNPEKQTDADQQ